MIKIVFKGVLKGHNDWITSIAPGIPAKEDENSDLLVTGSHDKSLMTWKLEGAESDDAEVADDTLYGYPLKKLTDHKHLVTELALSNDNCFALSFSKDKTLRLWDLRTGKSSILAVDHIQEVLSCFFPHENRQIISTDADKAIKFWNTVVGCKFASEESNHTDCGSRIRFFPTQEIPFSATAGRDDRVKIWDSDLIIKYSFKPHDTDINSLTIHSTRRYIATAGTENCVKIWDLEDLSQEIHNHQTVSTVNQVAFNPMFPWIAVATETGVQLFDLSSESDQPIGDIIAAKPKCDSKQRKAGAVYGATSLAWSTDGKKLYVGFTDNLIRVYYVNSDQWELLRQCENLMEKMLLMLVGE